MTARALFARILAHEGLNFVLTNRLPRRWLTVFMGWWSRIENPLVCRASIAVWRAFSDLDLSEARQTRFATLQECFTRELKDGARPIDRDPATLASPCDALVGACGEIRDGLVLQAKGSPYRLEDLLCDPELARSLAGGRYATLRLTSTMYHRFHAPDDLRVERIDYVAGDAWNVNPPALARVQRLYCRNERAVVRCRLADGAPLVLVPVAAILVASMRFRFVDVRLHLRYRGPNVIPCDARLAKGEEMGWFEHGSTIIVLAPPGYAPAPDAAAGGRIRMGEALLRREG